MWSLGTSTWNIFAALPMLLIHWQSLCPEFLFKSIENKWLFHKVYFLNWGEVSEIIFRVPKQIKMVARSLEVWKATALTLSSTYAAVTQLQTFLKTILQTIQKRTICRIGPTPIAHGIKKDGVISGLVKTGPNASMKLKYILKEGSSTYQPTKIRLYGFIISIILSLKPSCVRVR